MKDIHEVLRQKQAKYAQLGKQIEMLQQAAEKLRALAGRERRRRQRRAGGSGRCDWSGRLHGCESGGWFWQFCIEGGASDGSSLAVKCRR
jgi:hypothetical protein